MDDESLAMFMAVTDQSREVASRYLDMTDGNSQSAIELYFEQPDLASSMPSQQAPPIPTTTQPQQAPRASREVVNVDSDDGEEEMDIDDGDDTRDDASIAQAVGRAADFEDDEAIARRMQEELYAGGDASGGFDADGVRAPIGRTTETLMGESADWAPDDMHAAVLEQMRARAQPRSTGLNHPSTYSAIVY